VANNKAYSTLADANAAAAEYNKPEAVNDRIANVYRDQNPLQALQYGTAAKQASLADMEMPLKQQEIARKLRDEGALATSKAMLTGNASLVRKTFSAQGDMSLVEDPIVTKQVRDIPGVGKIDTFNYKGTLVGKDGKTEPFEVNSHDFSMSLLPYKDFIDTSRKSVASDAAIQSRSDMLDLKGKQIEMQTQLGLARVEAAQAKGGSAGTREGRLIATTLLLNAERDTREAQKAKSKIQSSRAAAMKEAAGMGQDIDPANPKGPKIVPSHIADLDNQIADLDEQIKAGREQQKTYSGMLVDSQVPAGSKPGLAKPATASGPPGGKYLGTSGGKKVWELPDGSKVKEK
jgi:hypothetical protein